MKKTGERVIETEYIQSANEYFIYLCHIATYKFAISYVKEKNVLEFGCGSGYGSHFIAPYCKKITAVDISEQAIEYSKTHYTRENLSFETIGDINQEPLHFQDNSFDTVITFQVIEHIKNENKCIDELYRVLKPGGKIVVVTPDRKTRLFRFQKPWNMFHVKEYDIQTLTNLVDRKFEAEGIYFMTAREDLLHKEITRTKKLRLILLPFTLGFIPEFIRVNMISFIKKISSGKTKIASEKIDFDFDENDIYINKNDKNSINLFVIGKKATS